MQTQCSHAVKSFIYAALKLQALALLQAAVGCWFTMFCICRNVQFCGIILPHSTFV